MLRTILFTTALFALTTPVMAAEPSESSVTDPAEAKAATAAHDGLVWLASRQHEDGSFGTGKLRGNVAVTALTGIAFLSGGHTPNRGIHGEQVARIVDYLMSQTEQSGFIVNREALSRGPMYGHGFATMFLAECYGMSRRPELRAKLAAAVKLIVDSQNSEGGWRYWPDSPDADISVTICQVMALRAARNAGIHVPKKTIDRCIDYVKRCQNPDGGFSYMLTPRGESAMPRSAAGVVALYSAGVYKGAEIDRGLDYLTQFLPKNDQTRPTSHYFYAQYYAMAAMWQAGGQRWNKWRRAARDDVLSRRVDNEPYWTSLNTDDYATAMACIVLQMANDSLPIFQR